LDGVPVALVSVGESLDFLVGVVVVVLFLEVVLAMVSVVRVSCSLLMALAFFWSDFDRTFCQEASLGVTGASIVPTTSSGGGTVVSNDTGVSSTIVVVVF